jgi:transcriptional regulator with XRE-family HTH domain
MTTKDNRRLTAEQRHALGLRLLQRRRSLRWSQRELGRRTGIRYVRVSKLENGRVTPSVPELILLAEALNAGLDELVLGTPPGAAPDGPLPVAELEELGSPEEWAVIGKLLRAMVTGLKLGAGRGGEA